MTYYSILNVSTQQTTSGIVARDRAEALALLGQQLEREFTDVDDGTAGAADFLLDEWHEPGPHWVNHHIPIFFKREAR